MGINCLVCHSLDWSTEVVSLVLAKLAKEVLEEH